MQLIAALPFKTVLTYFASESMLWVITEADSVTYLVQIDPESFKSIAVFPVSGLNHLSTPVFDEDYGYLMKQTGEMVRIDKWAGTLDRVSPLGVVISMTDLWISDDRIGCVVAIPLSNGRKTEINTAAVMLLDKNGKKVAQSRSFRSPMKFDRSEGHLFVSSERKIFELDPETLEDNEIAAVNIHPDCQILSWGNYICSLSYAGTMEIVSHGLRIGNWVFGKTSCQPYVGEDLWWPLSNSIVRFDTTVLADIYYPLPSFPYTGKTIRAGDDLLFATAEGTLSSFSLSKYEDSHIKLTSKPLGSPVAVGNFVFVSSDDSIFKVAV